MAIRILSKSPKMVSFILEGTNPAYANALRKIMISEIPTMAVDFVDIHKNTTALFDEIIAHRLGLIPLTFDQKIYELKDRCKCNEKGCTHCRVVLALERTGPCIVTAADLKSTDESVQPVEKDIPIVELLEGQEIVLEATASLGLGKDHAKHQAAVVGYRYQPSVRINKEKCSSCGACIKKCPKNILVTKDREIGTQNANDCTLCMACIDACPEKAITVSGDPSKIIFSVESVSGLTSEDIIKKAVDILEERTEELQKNINKAVK